MIRWLLAALLAISPAHAEMGEMMGYWANDHIVRLTAGTACVEDTSNAETYSIAVTTGASDGVPVVVVVGILAEDSATVYTLDNNATIDGAATSILDDDGGANQASAVMIATTRPITGAGTVTVALDWSEAVTSSLVCAWALENLESPTPTSTVNDDAGSGGTVLLSLTTTKRGGYALGVCGTGGTSQTWTWAVLTERSEFGNTESEITNADAVTTGASMDVTCAASAGGMTGVAAAFR